MLLAVGMVIVFVSCIGGFAVAGGNPVTLIHAGEIMIICGIGLGILVVSSPKSVLMNLKEDIIKAFKGESQMKVSLSIFLFLCLSFYA